MHVAFEQPHNADVCVGMHMYGPLVHMHNGGHTEWPPDGGRKS